MILNDVTAEALDLSLSEHAGFAVVLADESTIFQNLLGRYSGDKEPNLKPLLLGYDGGRNRTRRIGRPMTEAREPLIALCSRSSPSPRPP